MFLDYSKREIRLLIVLKRRWQNRILPTVEFAPNCRLDHATYSSSKGIRFGVYETLFYTWGRPNISLPPRFITLNSAQFEVRENLYYALRYLALDSKDRILWVDVICINQNDTRKKNHQVQQIGDIYRIVFQVILWLGLSSPGTKRVIKFIDQYSSIYFKQLKGTAKDRWKVKAIKQLKDICERDYWSRVWIIQEIGLASKLLVVCSNYQFPWDNLDPVL